MSPISSNINLSAEAVVDEIRDRQQLPWNSGGIARYREYPALQELFSIINSGIPREDFFYQGNLFRLHTPYIGIADDIDSTQEEVVSKICDDGSCSIHPKTRYSNAIVAFSKNFDFTDNKIYYKVAASMPAILIHVNTRNHYGIDVNKLMERFGCKIERYEREQEVLFPLQKEFVVKEYKETPNKFRYYLRRYTALNESEL